LGLPEIIPENNAPIRVLFCFLHKIPHRLGRVSCGQWGVSSSLWSGSGWVRWRVFFAAGAHRMHRARTRRSIVRGPATHAASK